jgi:hypothetical protein
VYHADGKMNSWIFLEQRIEATFEAWANSFTPLLFNLPGDRWREMPFVAGIGNSANE